MTHEHEAWMLEESAKGGTYCRACGNAVSSAPSITFSSTLAEAAWAIANHGFTEAEYDIPKGDGWNALLSLNSVTLLNIGQPPSLLEPFRAEHGDSTLLVWLRVSREGQVSVVKYAVENSADARTVEHDYYAAADGPESDMADDEKDFDCFGCGCDSGTH